MAGINGLENPFLRGLLGQRIVNEESANNELRRADGLLGILGKINTQGDEQRKRELISQAPGILQSGDRNRIAGLFAGVGDIKGAYGVMAPKATKHIDMGGSIGIVDETGNLVGSFPKSISPDTQARERGLDSRYDRPSANADLAAETARLGHDVTRRGQNISASTAQRGQDIQLTKISDGAFRLGDGSSVTRPQLIQQYKLENKLMDDLDLQILAKTDPVRASKEREKINSSLPFDQWAMDRFGVDVMGGRAVPGIPKPAPGIPKPTAEQRKVLDGKAYVKRNGQWFAE